MREEDNFRVLPNMCLREAREENFGELGAAALAIAVGRGILGNNDVGVSEVGVSTNEVGPVGAVGRAKRILIAVNAVDKDNDSWTKKWLGMLAEDEDVQIRARMIKSARWIVIACADFIDCLIFISMLRVLIL